ncbi:M48 family metallopeptidase [Oceanobacter mangrovi]|uniref:M48 family metallopeptidase n=1 Tax=Oceanobacter mangrovi TaxID=2862510 RepID=UPI001C8E2B2B|nr:M48 family metallopeptidase [Oceanobacter mangrovi]
MGTPLPTGNPKLPDEINNAHQAPVKDFLILAFGLLGTVVLAALLLGWSASWLAPLVPYQWERDWFAASPAAASMPETAVSQTPVDPQSQALQQLMDQLLQTQSQPLPVDVHYLPDIPEPNAFATIGGHIFVTAGLLRSVSSENALAMVLAHEYGHIQMRHPITLALEQATLGLLLSLVGGDPTGFSQWGAGLTMLSFSRDMERDSDQQALAMLQQHYGHTLGAEEFFEKMLEQHEESRWQAVFQTHPLTSERLAAINAASAYEQQQQQQLTPLPQALQPAAD